MAQPEGKEGGLVQLLPIQSCYPGRPAPSDLPHLTSPEQDSPVGTLTPLGASLNPKGPFCLS